MALLTVKHNEQKLFKFASRIKQRLLYQFNKYGEVDKEEIAAQVKELENVMPMELCHWKSSSSFETTAKLLGASK